MNSTTLRFTALLGLLALSGCFEDKPKEAAVAPAAPVAVAPAASAPAATPAPAPVAAPAATPAPVAAAQPAPAKPKAAKPAPAPAPKAAPCDNCGVVVSINVIEQKGKGSGVGAIAGGVAGGVLGHQVGDGTGKDVATAVGVIGGAIIGNKIEQNMKKTNVWDVAVKMDVSGETRILRHAADPGVAAGDKVKVVNDQIVRQ